MKKPYIYFCGDKEKCKAVSDIFKDRIKSIFITDKNLERYLDSSDIFPVLICIIFNKGIFASNKLFKKLYSYSARSGCPIHAVGSRKNIATAVKYNVNADIQRSSLSLMTKTINELYQYTQRPDYSEFELLKSRFANVAVISDNAASLAMCENKTDICNIKSRIIAIPSGCGKSRYEQLKNISLSQVITDTCLNENSLELFRTASKNNAPAILLDSKIPYGKSVKAFYVDSASENNRISKLLNDYNSKKSKMLYLKNK